MSGDFSFLIKRISLLARLVNSVVLFRKRKLTMLRDVWLLLPLFSTVNFFERKILPLQSGRNSLHRGPWSGNAKLLPLTTGNTYIDFILFHWSLEVITVQSEQRPLLYCLFPFCFWLGSKPSVFVLQCPCRCGPLQTWSSCGSHEWIQQSLGHRH